MAEIKKLSDQVIRLIAAGEVVEGPRSIVKELLENAIDAKANVISIELINGGHDLIRVSDNGVGMKAEDLLLCTERHTTSKVYREEDLYRIGTLGFRGEFLASLVSVADVTIISKHRTEDQAWKIVDGPNIRNTTGHRAVQLEKSSRATGTTVEVRNLFDTTPARKKFMNSPRTDAIQVTELVQKFRLAYPTINLNLKQGNKILFKSIGVNPAKSLEVNRLNAIHQVLGKSAKNMLKLSGFHKSNNWMISGWIGKPTETRSNRKLEFFILNNRIIESKLCTQALETGYQSYLPQKQFPIAVIYISGPLDAVDVNVHPSKLEVRFKDEDEIFDLISQAVQASLQGTFALQKNLNENKAQKSYRHKSLIPRALSSPVPDVIHKRKNLIVTTDEKEVIHDPNPDNLAVIAIEEDNDPYSSLYVTQKGKRGGMLPLSHVVDRRKIMDLTAITQLQDTYILAESKHFPESLFVIDQHALAERIALEQILEDKTGHLVLKKIRRQSLLVPIIITVSPSEKQQFVQIKDDLLRFGYHEEEFGPSQIIIRAVPILFGRKWVLRSSQSRSLYVQEFRELLNPRIGGTSSRELELAKMIACKNSLKAGHKLTRDEMNLLLEKARTVNFPFVCCHGRPAILELKYKELAKLFWR